MTAAVVDLAQRIMQAHDAATGSMRDAVGHAVRAGELLAQARAALPHGAFGAFCAALPFAETTARGYMRLARLDPAKRQRVADMPLRLALLEVAEPRLAGQPRDLGSAGSMAPIDIPVGNFGTVMWRGPADEVLWFEVHPVLWPDGETVGLHYAYAEVPEVGDAVCDCSCRPIRAATVGVQELASGYGAPLEAMRVFRGKPVLWSPPPKPPWAQRQSDARLS